MSNLLILASYLFQYKISVIARCGGTHQSSQPWRGQLRIQSKTLSQQAEKYPPKCVKYVQAGLIPGWIKAIERDKVAYLHSCEHTALNITKNLIDGCGLLDSPSGLSILYSSTEQPVLFLLTSRDEPAKEERGTYSQSISAPFGGGLATSAACSLVLGINLWLVHLNPGLFFIKKAFLPPCAP